uniref:O-antigen polymerase n=1 Tax=Magnetococcus massalia (strain MO-1) TaxID=451514 RepID=A0A1S7LG58_MAGMO|nr:protein of unknown function[similar to O-antigen polymerase from Magnetococcus sp. MC-1] [Candidatus Magnetococcus massalia]
MMVDQGRDKESGDEGFAELLAEDESQTPYQRLRAAKKGAASPLWMNDLHHAGTSKEALKEQHGVLYALFLAHIFFAPLALGGVLPWTQNLFAIGLLVLLLVWWILQYGKPLFWQQAIRRNALAVTLVSLWLVAPVASSMPIPATLLAIISPAAYELRLFTGQSGLLPHSLAPHQTLENGLMWLTFLSCFWLTLVLVTSRKRLRILFYCLVMTAALQSILSLLIIPTLQTFLENGENHFELFGTFTNYNHFYGFLILALPIPCGLLIALIRSQSGIRTKPTTFQNLLELFHGKLGPLSFVIVIIALSFFAIPSKIATISIAIPLFLLFLATLLRSYRSTRERQLLPLLLIFFIAGLSWVSIKTITAPEMTEKINTIETVSQWPVVKKKIFDYIRTGSGGGSHTTVFSLYHQNEEFSHLKQADILNIINDYGILGLLFWLTGALYCLVLIFMGFLKRQDALMRGALFASLASLTGILIFSTMSYSLFTLVNGMIFYTLLGVGLVSLNLPNRLKRNRSHRKN